MFRRVLIANRGEVACRIVRACKELGVECVAVFSRPDARAPFTRAANRALCIGPGPAHLSYANARALLTASKVGGCDALHPGYGFLSENADFAGLCQQAELSFVGPSQRVLSLAANKLRAKEAMARLGVPVTKGWDLGDGQRVDPDHIKAGGQALGFPVMVKAAHGGGGRGIRVVRDESALQGAIEAAATEAKAHFADAHLYLEPYLEGARHIEFQVAADCHGRAVCLGERECSVQRRHQKIVEEAPSSVLCSEDRAYWGSLLTSAALKLGLVGLATFEFLYSREGTLQFMEINPRLQVEHPVTEVAYGVDLVVEQLRLAAGYPLSEGMVAAAGRGPLRHAVEVRVCAEDPITFCPCPGTVVNYQEPHLDGVRVDSALDAGSPGEPYHVPHYYDGLLCKIIGYDKDRLGAIERVTAALSELRLLGISHNVPLLQGIMCHPVFLAGDLGVDVARFVADGLKVALQIDTLQMGNGLGMET